MDCLSIHTLPIFHKLQEIFACQSLFFEVQINHREKQTESNRNPFGIFDKL